MKNNRRREAIIKKLNMIYKRGYMPTRDVEKYSELHANTVNCFGHSCFNLTNNSLEELKEYINDLKDFFRNFEVNGIQNYFKEAKKRIEQVGLRIEQSSLKEPIKKNQWKIAYYVMYDPSISSSDLHFMIQSQDGKWISKMGKHQELEVFKKLPNTFHRNYDLCGVYKITNPYVKLDDEENLEM